MTSGRDYGAVASVAVTSLVRRAGRLAGHLARTSYVLSRRLPGADSVAPPLAGAVGDDATPGAGLRRPETVWARATADGGDGEGRTPVSLPASPPDRLRREMADLLDTSTDEGHAREHLYATVLAQLAPDEARILSVLADGTPFPVLDVTVRSAFGRSGRVLLRGASTVGKAAGVALPGHVPAYVTRLHALGLVEISDEDRSLDTQYDVLVTDETVVEAAGRASRAGFTRRTLRVTDLGADLWQACAPDRDVPPAPSEREGAGKSARVGGRGI